MSPIQLALDPVDTTPCAFNPSISSSEYPAARSTSAVC
jgi:hypothetical protein